MSEVYVRAPAVIVCVIETRDRDEMSYIYSLGPLNEHDVTADATRGKRRQKGRKEYKVGCIPTRWQDEIEVKD